MSSIDWIVLFCTLTAIVLYGLFKSRTSKNLDGYFLSNRSLPWYMVLFSIMGTQASAITFLSAPGQAFTDGMRFVQYYFGLPLAMIVISISFVPLFKKLQVFTAYEFLEQRFDLKTRTFTSVLFLLSRGFSTGISIYAPSIILSSLLGWDIFWTNIFMGGILIIYTVSGGAKAVAYTQQLQLGIIFLAMLLAGYFIVHQMPSSIHFTDALYVSGASGKLNVITTGISKDGFDWKDKYNMVSGIIGGFFLALSYFGTDQSQVGRYLTSKSIKESRLGLLMNGLVKIPMQFLILLLGALLFSYYQFNTAPIFFNKAVPDQIFQSKAGDTLQQINEDFEQVSLLQSKYAMQYATAVREDNLSKKIYKDSLQFATQKANILRDKYKATLKNADASIDTNDSNYIFIRYVVDHLPIGLVGLIIAVIFLASWGSIAAALNGLASSTMIDFYLRFHKHNSFPAPLNIAEKKNYQMSKWFTLGWGIFSIFIAQFAHKMGSLIEAVNVLGSLFYGVMLGIFLVAFYIKKINGNAVFKSALFSEIGVIILFYLDNQNIIGLGFLWLNVVGALSVILFGFLFQNFEKRIVKTA
ncbi:MAG: sodium:solute symporter [Bacteroidetes bacterium]|nr:sodium:solute symporter [Bacteroidota bacterium]